jgi:negative regulator of replication initiation
VPRTKYTAANRLSQRPCTELDNINKANKVDINNFINTKLNAFSVAPVTVREAKAALLTNRYSEDSWQIARFLTTLQKLAGLNKAEFRSFKHKALQYAVTDSNLY